VNLIARPATPGRGFDTDQKVSEIVARALKSLGYTWCCRYVPISAANDTRQDIDATELTMLTDLGFEVSLVQHPRYEGWNPGEHSGLTDGSFGAQWARRVGLPTGCHLYIDLEGIAEGCTTFTATKYTEDWATSAKAEGLPAGCYVGYQIPLDPDALYFLHGITSYWSDAANRRVTRRGCAIKQGRTMNIAGIQIDEDVIAPDNLGDLPMVCAAGPTESEVA
jgi:hypothetical protein